METGYTPEIMEKAKTAKSAEELLALAKENDYPLTEEEAKAYFEQMNKPGELSDNELENVAGGGCNDKKPTAEGSWCEHFKCVHCGKDIDNCTCSGEAFTYTYRCCGKCKYVRYKNCKWWCTNPQNN